MRDLALESGWCMLEYQGPWTDRRLAVPAGGGDPVVTKERLERRLSAIMAADVVGYSGLMERDEAGTFARLKKLRKELIEPILARYGGRFVDLKGDGAIVEFQSVVEAVEAAVEIQTAMQAQ